MEEMPSTSPVQDVTAINLRFYESLWSGTTLRMPQRFNTWPLISRLAETASTRLEIGPGMSPRFPISGTHFMDLSPTVTRRLKGLGGIGEAGSIEALPYPERHFDLVGAFDVIEHVQDDQRAFAEISRVLKDDGILVCSVPLHPESWTEFDTAVGHYRRYRPEELRRMLDRHDLVPDQSAVFGMQPKSRLLLKLGIWMLTRHRTFAMFWYNRVFEPLACRFQKALKLEATLIDMRQVDEIILVSHRRPR